MNDKNGSTVTKQTLVEEGTEFVGKLSSKCPIVVMGNVEGDVTGPIIHVTSSGVVAGNVKVKELRSEGELAGSVEAEVVAIAGRIRDRTVIRARTLEMSLKADKRPMEVVFGECELAIGDEPNKAAAIAAVTPEARKPEAPAEGPAPVPAAEAREESRAADAPVEASQQTATEQAADAAKPVPPEDNGSKRKRGSASQQA
jgi:cytoskeletal protein CcmA (bactofilin family)